MQCSKLMLHCMMGCGAAMPFLTELGEVLHEEHFRILLLICGLENRVIGAEGRRPMDPRCKDLSLIHI